MGKVEVLFPGTFGLELHWVVPKAVEFIAFRWLDAEIDDRAEERLPILRELGGYRNREVYTYVQAHTERIDEVVLEMYGKPHKEGYPIWRQSPEQRRHSFRIIRSEQVTTL